jgi:hypothetical protein
MESESRRSGVSYSNHYSVAFPFFFASAHLAFINAAIFFLAAGDIVRFRAGFPAFP